MKERLLRAIRADRHYEEALKQYARREGWSAVALFGIMSAAYAALGWLSAGMARSETLAVGIAFNAAISLVTLPFARRFGRGLSSVGLTGGNVRASLTAGGIFAAILFFCNCLSNLLAGENLLPWGRIAPLAIYYLSIAVCEEVVFRGYVGTRMYALTGRKSFSLLVTGVLFVLMHFPFRMAAYGKTFGELIGNVSWIADLFLTHILLSLIYLKTNSLYGAILPHWVSNLAYAMIAR